MRTLNRRTCGLLRAATIEAQMRRRTTAIGGFVTRDRREYRQPEVKTIKMTPAELDLYIKEQSKHWGHPVEPLKNIV
jgi:hypothetical protein